MARLLGILLLVVGLYALLYTANPNALAGGNLLTLARIQGYFGVLTLGMSVLIISGGIDLSVGAVVALCAALFGLFCSKGLSPILALLCVLVIGAGIGLLHGFLVTKVRLQPFLVTLCGLFAYRGLARYFADNKTVSLTEYRETTDPSSWAGGELSWLLWLANGKITLPLGWLGLGEVALPTVLLLTLVLAAVLAVFLHGSVYGRCLFAVGGNEEAARYAGVPTTRYKILAYVICSTLAALGGALELLREPSVNPANAGSFYELYAITGAVLGGCSLSGGEGNVLGVLLGTFVLPILRQLPTWLPQVPDSLQYTIIGVVLLLGTIADEWFKRRAASRK
jgi:ribose transport system permease protein